jgi:F0F1-type ATP synthase assembly protein I
LWNSKTLSISRIGWIIAGTCARQDSGYGSPMKFLAAMFAYLAIGIVLGWGILLTVKGNPWLLIAGFLGYVVLLGAIGCIPQKSDH